MDKGTSSTGGIVVYDSNCVLCSNTVRFLVAIDRKKKLRFTSFDSKLWNELENGYNGGIPFLNTVGRSESIVFYKFSNLPAMNSVAGVEDIESSAKFQNENYFFQSDAVIKIIETLSFPWNLLLIIKLIPRRLREKSYRIVARNRFVIFGKKTSCKIPSDRIKERYIL